MFSNFVEIEPILGNIRRKTVFLGLKESSEHLNHALNAPWLPIPDCERNKYTAAHSGGQMLTGTNNNEYVAWVLRESLVLSPQDFLEILQACAVANLIPLHLSLAQHDVYEVYLLLPHYLTSRSFQIKQPSCFIPPWEIVRSLLEDLQLSNKAIIWAVVEKISYQWTWTCKYALRKWSCCMNYLDGGFETYLLYEHDVRCN